MLACVAFWAGPSPAADLVFGDAQYLAAPLIIQKVDENYSGIIACDTREQLREIIQSEDSSQTYFDFRMTLNAKFEPICIEASLDYGDVLGFEPAGVMRWNNEHFKTWILEIGDKESGKLNSAENLWLLYYEHFVGYDI
jgi:hypothetical protein